MGLRVSSFACSEREPLRENLHKSCVPTSSVKALMKFKAPIPAREISVQCFLNGNLGHHSLIFFDENKQREMCLCRVEKYSVIYSKVCASNRSY